MKNEGRQRARAGVAARSQQGRRAEQSRFDLATLLGRTRAELVALAKEIGLARVSKLKKEELAARIADAAPRPAPRPVVPEAAASAPAEAAPGPAAAPPAAPGIPVETSAPGEPAGAPPRAVAEPPPVAEPPVREQEREPAATAKLDLGPEAGAAEKPGADIPWSYGQDRVTAMAIDPARLFVYWEVTDPAIERARAQLGPGGPGAWLNVRVYDTSGRIFDGTNARSYFDHRVERYDRQWFFHVGKPSSTAYVEIGLRSHEGFFARIGRSGRVDFPRAEGATSGEPEWLTVRVATGETWHAGRGGPNLPHHAAAPGAASVPLFEPAPSGGDGHQREIRIWQLLHGDFQRIEWEQLLGGAGWFELEGRTEWEGPVLVTSWEAGPFSHPVSIEPPSREEWEGRSFAYRVGDVTHVVYGPWQVVIRNLGAFRERAEIARWEVFRSWVAAGGREVRVSARGDGVRIGASERLGASERRWIAGSEVRLGGASEVWRIGASEVRMRGASETLLAGASQWMLRGASERRLGGASEVRMRGASERRLGGASESRLGGASEQRLGGASERRLGGASEQRLGGASESRLARGGEQPGGGEHDLPPQSPDGSDAAGPLPYPKLEG